MAHELTIRRDGKVEMAYVKGVAPWHGLGTEVPPGTSLDKWIEAAGMEWEINSAPVMYSYNDQVTTVSDRIVLHRNDTGAALGIVSSDYHPVQPKEVMEFFRDLIESLGLEMKTAGTLFGGRRFWATALIGAEALVDNRDEVRGYLLLSTSADGSLATTARFTSICTVCNNTLTMAHNSSAAKVRTIHSTKFDPVAAKKTLGVAPKTFEEFMGQMRQLASTPVSLDRATLLTDDLLGTDSGPVSKRIMELFSGEAIGADYAGRGQTAWGWLNSVTQFVDHDRKAKSDSHRLNSALFGSGERTKVRALELVMGLVD